MSVTPELVYQMWADHYMKVNRFLLEKHSMGICAFCGKKCYKQFLFCSEIFIQITDKKGEIKHISECCYDYFKNRELELLEWITE